MLGDPSPPPPALSPLTTVTRHPWPLPHPRPPGEPLLNLLTAAPGSLAYAVAHALVRLEQLSHVLVWAGSPPETSRRTVIVAMLPYLKCDGHSWVFQDGGEVCKLASGKDSQSEHGNCLLQQGFLRFEVGRRHMRHLSRGNSNACHRHAFSHRNIC